MNYQLRVTAALCVAMLSSSACAGLIPLPTTLDVLLPDGDFVVVGDYAFDEFTYIAGGDMPIASQIQVSALPGGIRFTGPFVDLPGGPGNGGSNAELGYTVTTTAGISEVLLRGNPSLLGGSGSASVTETFPGFPTIKADIYDDPRGALLESFVSLGATVNTLEVVKGIVLLTKDPSRSATLSVIDQVVPEPVGLMLALFGFIGLGALHRSRRNASSTSN